MVAATALLSSCVIALTSQSISATLHRQSKIPLITAFIFHSPTSAYSVCRPTDDFVEMSPLRREPDGALRRTKRTFLKRRFVVRQKSSPNIPEQSSPMFASSPKKFAYQPAVPFSLRCAYPAMMSNVDVTAPKQRGVPFRPGVSGNPAGRPRGARSKLSENFLADLRDVWERRGKAALEACAEEQPDVLIKVIASLLPKSIDINVAVDVADFATKFHTACAMLGNDPPRPRKPLPGQSLVIEHDDGS